MLGLVALWLIIALIQPTQFTYERSMEINAPKEVVFAQVNELKNWKNWEPWSAADATIQSTYAEQTAGVGGNYSWTSKKSGNGKITITESTPATSIKTDIELEGRGISQGWFKMEDGSANNTKTTWGMSFDIPFPFNAMIIFMGSQLNKMFDNGLMKLKTVSEQQAQTPAQPSFNIQTVDFPGKTYLAIRDKVNIGSAEISKFFGDNVTTLMGLVQGGKVKMNGVPTGMFFEWNEAAKMTDMAVAVPVADASQAPGGAKNVQVVKLPASQALMIEYQGGYWGSGAAHLALGEHVKANGLKEKTPVVEEYIVSQPAEPDSNKWVTKIYYLIEQ